MIHSVSPQFRSILKSGDGHVRTDMCEYSYHYRPGPRSIWQQGSSLTVEGCLKLCLI